MNSRLLSAVACGALLTASAAVAAEEEKKESPTYVKVQKASIEFCGS